MDIRTLSYWHRLEHFYPYILKEQQDEKIKTFYIESEMNFPNFRHPEIPEDKIVRYYEVYMGLFQVKDALKLLEHKLSAKKEFSYDGDENSCFCKFRLNADGTFDQQSFRVSSFPWAVQRVKNGQIIMDNWSDEFHAYEKTIFQKLYDATAVYTYDICENVLQVISKTVNWNIQFESCWMRIDRVIRERKKGEEEGQGYGRLDETLEQMEENQRVDALIKNNDLLNSFFVRDLERVIEHTKKKEYGKALESYMNHKADYRINIEQDKDALFKLFAPDKMPYGKWPSGYSLRTMQQAAVNLVMEKSEAELPLFSVNGPPGTGKTTLLRDVIAANVVERARVLCGYRNPDEAFGDEKGVVEYNGFQNRVRDLDPRLKKYSILVASSNNNAVKNITKELPDAKSISAKYKGDYAYFKEVSDRVLNSEGTWGLCAAALGNRDNCKNFIDAFWPIRKGDKEDDEKFNLNKYLRERHNEAKNSLENERLLEWNEAKSRFLSAYEEVGAEYEKMNTYYRELKKWRQKNEEKDVLGDEYNKEQEKGRELLKEKNSLEQGILHIENELRIIENKKSDIKRTVPFFELRYFCRSKNQMICLYRELEDDANQMLLERFTAEDKLRKIEVSIQTHKVQMESYEQQLSAINEEIHGFRNALSEWEMQDDTVYPDEEFLSRLTGEASNEEREAAQNVAPWNSDRLNEMREKLFLEAMNVHRVFVENSEQMITQLDAFGKMIRGIMSISKMKELSGILLQSFMLMVPVVSTTFASVGNFLKYIGKEELGIVLIDEAGQAIPQSAVGTIWRSKRTVVVGDPLQIDPVVTIHDATIQCLKKYFCQTDFIASKETSVQSLADQANMYIGIRNMEGHEYYVGAPLLVHGRCQRKIFDIANSIAYNDKMIYATKDVDETVCKWLHVRGDAQNGHFVKEQLEAVLDIIIQAFEKNCNKHDRSSIPELFLISPFRSVRAGIAKYLKNNDFLYKELLKRSIYSSKENVSRWINKCIGTIHTFQGKEAETVIICLGVSSDNSGNGAIEWASRKPNILNVAVTRAKRNLYIVGDINKWAGKQYFSTAYEICNR